MQGETMKDNENELSVS